MKSYHFSRDNFVSWVLCTDIYLGIVVTKRSPSVRNIPSTAGLVISFADAATNEVTPSRHGSQETRRDHGDGHQCNGLAFRILQIMQSAIPEECSQKSCGVVELWLPMRRSPAEVRCSRNTSLPDIVTKYIYIAMMTKKVCTDS